MAIAPKQQALPTISNAARITVCDAATAGWEDSDSITEAPWSKAPC
jgi:hypothetical protein